MPWFSHHAETPGFTVLSVNLSTFALFYILFPLGSFLIAARQGVHSTSGTDRRTLERNYPAHRVRKLSIRSHLREQFQEVSIIDRLVRCGCLSFIH